MKHTSRASNKCRELTCPASIRLVPLVAKRQSDDGDEGSYIHWAIADRLIREMGATPPEGGLPPPDVPAGYKLPAFSAWIIDWAVRHVRETVPADWSLMVEASFAYEYDRYIDSGHADVTALSPDATAALGIDWKTGRDPVDPAECNEQVATYLTLYKRAWETLHNGTFQIVQPRMDEDDGFERVSTVTVTDIDALVAGMERRMNEALDNATQLNSCLKACRWCEVGCQCPALQADKNHMKLTLTPEAIAKIRHKPDDATLGDWVVTMRTLAQPAKDAQEMLHERLDACECVTAGCGVTITRKIQKGTYEVPDPVQFFGAVRGLLPKDDAIARAFKPSMTALKDEIAAELNCPKTGKAPVTAEGVFDATLRPLVKQNDRKVLIFTQ